MLDHDPAESATCESTILDEIEPEADHQNIYREAAIKNLAFMVGAFQFIADAQTVAEHGLRFWAVMIAIDHPALNGRSASEIAHAKGYTRAALNKHTVAFERANQLPPAFSQKSQKARQAYREARISQLSNDQ